MSLEDREALHRERAFKNLLEDQKRKDVRNELKAKTLAPYQNLSLHEQVIKKNIAFMYGRDQSATSHDPDKRSFAKSVPKLNNTDIISSFTNEYDFLAPEYPCEVCIFDELEISYPSYEHALQASKLDDMEQRNLIRQTTGMREIKKLTMKASQQSSWKNDCFEIARKILRDKFVRNKNLTNRLMQIKNMEFQYKNDYGDLFWGVDKDGKGQNKLGKLLYDMRCEIEANNDLELWIKSCFKLFSIDKVDITVTVEKDGIIIPFNNSDDANSIDNNKKNKIFNKMNKLYIGKEESNDVLTEHPSTSRLHAMLVIDEFKGCILIDCSSSNGTYINNNKIDNNSNDNTNNKSLINKRIKSYCSYKITSNDFISFGASNRQYKFDVILNGDVNRKQLLYEKLSDPSSYQLNDNDTTIFIRNLSNEAKEQDVLDFFNSCGKIRKYVFPVKSDERSKKTLLKGFGFVTFETVGGYMQGLSRDGELLLGEVLRVRKYVSRDESDERQGGDGGRKRPLEAGDPDGSSRNGQSRR